MISASRQASLFNGLNSVAKKVYNVVPINEAWTIQQILSELHRNSQPMTVSVVHGCLGNMAANGLVREQPKGEFRREAVRPPAPPETECKKPTWPSAKPTTSTPTAMEIAMATVTTVKPVKTVEPVSPIDRLGALAARVTAMANDLKALASDIADTALDVQSELENNAHDLTRLKQLQALLKDLG